MNRMPTSVISKHSWPADVSDQSAFADHAACVADRSAGRSVNLISRFHQGLVRSYRQYVRAILSVSQATIHQATQDPRTNGAIGDDCTLNNCVGRHRRTIIFAMVALLLAGPSQTSRSQELFREPSTDSVDDPSTESTMYRGALLRSEQITKDRLEQLKAESINSIAVLLQDSSGGDSEVQARACQLIQSSGMELNYWIDVGRCVSLAEKHPQWMASLQTHDEWRRLFPHTPEVGAHQVAKTYPWVPILSREPFAAQLERVETLLHDQPAASKVFLNHLQGGPSACGCGNTLCRWTSDYGKKRTTTPLEADAAALFVQALAKAAPASQIIPVWTTECEQHDRAADGQCAGVGCYDGICWKAWTRQLMPLSDSCSTMAALALYKSMHRDSSFYGPPASWIGTVIDAFSKMPSKHGGQSVSASRLIVALQGWNVSNEEIQAQVRIATKSSVAGYMIVYTELDQSWQPRVVSWR